MLNKRFLGSPLAALAASAVLLATFWSAVNAQTPSAAPRAAVSAAQRAAPASAGVSVRALHSGRVAIPYRVNLKPRSALKWPRARFVSGHVPPGLRLARASGTLRGAPVLVGTFTFRISFAMRKSPRRAFRYRLHIYPSSTPITAPPLCGATPAAPTWDHVVWVLFENESSSAVYGSPAAPYYNALARQCGVATNVHAVTHPSLPNYIALTSGGTQGITDDAAPALHPLNVPSIFSQLGAGSWKALNESMPANCFGSTSGSYAPRHNPAPYYTNIAAQCATQDIPLASGAVPDISARFTFVTPNVINDMHDSDVATGDAWLSGFVPRLTSTSEWKAGKTALFIDFDENDGSAGNQIATLVVSPSTARGLVSGTNYTHYSTLRTTEEMLGLGLLGNAASAPSMRAQFNLGS